MTVRWGREDSRSESIWEEREDSKAQGGSRSEGPDNEAPKLEGVGGTRDPLGAPMREGTRDTPDCKSSPAIIHLSAN
jgi:hypothetical protein